MTTPSSPTKTRNLVAAVLAGGLITSLSACGLTSTNTSSPVSESQPMAAQAGSPLVQCGMAQLTPRVAAGDPVLSRGSDFFTELDKDQQVPPAVQKVYDVDVSGLNETQKHEVLLFLSSLNECPGVSPDLQKSILDVFDQLTPRSVGDSDSDSDGVQSEVIRGDDSSYVDSDAVAVWADGEWDGHPWWFRPAWDHPVTEFDDWVQWGTDRHEHIIWRWDGHDWRRFGRPENVAPNHPYLPRSIGPGVLIRPAQRDGGNPVPNNVPAVPNQNQAPAGTGNNPAPDTNSQQGIARPQFDNNRTNTGTTGTTNGTAGTTTNTTPDNTTNGTARTNSSTTGDAAGTNSSTGTTSSGTNSSTGSSGSTSTGTGSGSSTSSGTGSTRTERGSSSDTGTTSTRERSSGSSEHSSSGSSSGGGSSTTGGGSPTTGSGGAGPIRN